ncbi:MAG: glycosyltransferase [Brevinematales bacterium]|nr:glycosyltransferase [Brevinematales bacterium]
MKFSIIIPSYNQGHFIRQTVESVLAQEGVEKEIFVIDGGSTDGTVDILRSYGEKIQWVSEKDRGQTEAINKGLRKATGDIVAYLNSDDYYLPGALSKVKEVFLSRPRTMWVTGDGIIVDANGKRIQKSISLYKTFWRTVGFPWSLYVMNCIIQPSTFWKREVLERVGFFDENKHYTMDYDYWLRLLKKGYKPVVLQEKLSAFRIHGESKGGARFEAQFAEDYDTLCQYCSSRWFRLLHRMHNQLIVGVYRVLK